MHKCLVFRVCCYLLLSLLFLMFFYLQMGDRLCGLVTVTRGGPLDLPPWKCTGGHTASRDVFAGALGGQRWGEALF